MADSPLKIFTLCVGIVLLLPACRNKGSRADDADEFMRLSNVGKAHLERGEAQPALAAFEKVLTLNPTHSDARLNLANACLIADQNERAIQLANSVLEQDRSSAAAYYIAGCANNHLRHFDEAVKNLTQAKNIDITVNAASLQLGLAYEGMTNYEAAIEQYQEIEKFEPDFPGLHYRLAQVYLRANRSEDTAKQLEAHRQWLAKFPNRNLSAAAIEKCKYTEARIPYRPELPDPVGVQVSFVDASLTAFGGKTFTGPVGVIDFAHDGRNHLLVRDGENFRVLLNTGGRFETNDQAFAITNGGRYTRWLIADLNKDNVPDALVLGDRGVHLYRFATNGTATETTIFAGLRDFAAFDGVFADLNFRGDLDLIAIATNGTLRVMSNLQNMYFVDTTTNGPRLGNVHQLLLDDWNNDDMQDLFVFHTDGRSTTVCFRQRGGAWSNVMSSSVGPVLPPRWGLSSDRLWASALGDMNNDLRPDLVAAIDDAIILEFNDIPTTVTFRLAGFKPTELKLIDYDNDGWLDIIGLGDGIRIWRNLGTNQFRDVTAALGLNKITGRIDSFAAADFDNDCDTDFMVSIENDSLHFLRNDGANANQQLKIQLQGTRSNPSGLGVKIDVSAGGLRLSRRVGSLPVEIGVRKHAQIDSVNAQWFELSPSYTDVKLNKCEPLQLVELVLPTGSCPYLYACDGDDVRFVSDFLCSSPLGLPIAPGKYVEADEDEIVWLGNEKNFKPKIASREDATRRKSVSGSAAVETNYVVHLTEELREVLYLDEAKLIVVDHPSGTEVHTTDKMLSHRPSDGYSRDEIITLHGRKPLGPATNERGVDVTSAIAEIDQIFASPFQLRAPQLRGLAEPHSVTLDFGVIETDKSLVLALTGWLRFGGAMANIAASTYSDFPFPFPTLEAEVNGQWQRVEVEVGAPSGRAKTILVDLANKVPSGTRRLRVTSAFEIHWDRIALFERADEMQTHVTRLAPTRSDLHWRGYSEMVEVGRDVSIAPLSVMNSLRTACPTLLVPNYAHGQSTPLWRTTPSGWATRYGSVDELISARDNALAIVAAGDELTLEFATDQFPQKPKSFVRDFFLSTSGWDKDADFHVAAGDTINPLPWHGLNDQIYGTQARPAFTNDAWIQKFNTRWVGARVAARR